SKHRDPAESIGEGRPKIAEQQATPMETRCRSAGVARFFVARVRLAVDRRHACQNRRHLCEGRSEYGELSPRCVESASHIKLLHIIPRLSRRPEAHGVLGRQTDGCQALQGPDSYSDTAVPGGAGADAASVLSSR